MKIILDIPDDIVHLITRKSIDDNITSEEVIIEHLKTIINSSSPLYSLLRKIEELKPGDQFNIKTLMGKKWKNIENPRTFGRKVKKHLIGLGYKYKKSNTRIYYTKPFK